MTRSGYTDDCENNWGLICYRGAVASSIRGKRGQAFLVELVSALDALPKQELIADSLKSATGEFCALGAVGNARVLDMADLDPDDIETVAGTFGISTSMAREIVWMNDEAYWGRTPEARWRIMREWALKHMAPPGDAP